MAIGFVFFATGRYFLRIPLRVTISTELDGRSVALDCLTAASVIFSGVSESNRDLISPEDAHGTFPFDQKTVLPIDGVAPPFHKPRSPSRFTSQCSGITPTSVSLYPGLILFLRVATTIRIPFSL